MSTVTKILIVVNLVLAVAVMGAAGAFLNAGENWKTKWDKDTGQLKNELSEKSKSLEVSQSAEREARTLQNKSDQFRSSAEAERDTQRANNELLQKKLNDATNSLEGLNNQFGNLRKDLDGEKARNENLHKDLDAARSDRLAANDKKAAAEAEASRLQKMADDLAAQVDALQKDKFAMAQDLEKTTTELEIYKRSGPPSVGITAKNHRGVVLAADSKMDIYLISIGSKDKVEVNDELTVYRGDRYVATVVVDRVYDDKAACYTKKGMKKMDVQQGDKVTSNL